MFLTLTPFANAAVNTQTNTISNGVNNTSASKRLWNLQDADILSVINEVSQETGKNFIVDPRINGKITLISSKPLREKEVYNVFISILSMLGYAAVEDGNIVKIVPSMESGEQATKIATNLHPGQGDEVVVRIFPLSNISATQIIPVIRPLLPQWSNIAAYAPGNVLILLGKAGNLDRINKVIQDIDQASNATIQMIPLIHASASQVAVVLNNLQTAGRVAGEMPTVSIAVDTRTNSILLSGAKYARVRMQVLIAQLDAPAKSSGGNTEVIYLRYLQAKDFAVVLSKIAQNILGKDTGSHFDAATSSNDVQTQSNTRGVSTSAAQSSAPTINASSVIQAETATNAIVITAPPSLMSALKAVIEKLDIRPAQVLVEAIIAEVDESDIASLGIQWGSLLGDDDKNSGGGGLATEFPKLGAGVLGIMPHVKIRSVLSLLQNQNGVNILSTPSIMVLDNQKATIEIGQQVPVQNGSYATTGGNSTVAPFNTFGTKDVTLKLDVTPQINLRSAVRLKLALKNDTLQNPQNPGLNPIINTSKIDNAVIVNTDNILVIGGLMSDANNVNINKVPFFGDLPGIGKLLFQQKAKNRSKKTLMVFLKPIIVSNDEDATILSENKYDQTMQTQANFVNDLSQIGDESPLTTVPRRNAMQPLPRPFPEQSN